MPRFCWLTDAWWTVGEIYAVGEVHAVVADVDLWAAVEGLVS